MSGNSLSKRFFPTRSAHGRRAKQIFSFVLLCLEEIHGWWMLLPEPRDGTGSRSWEKKVVFLRHSCQMKKKMWHQGRTTQQRAISFIQEDDVRKLLTLAYPPACRFGSSRADMERSDSECTRARHMTQPKSDLSINTRLSSLSNAKVNQGGSQKFKTFITKVPLTTPLKTSLFSFRALCILGRKLERGYQVSFFENINASY